MRRHLLATAATIALALSPLQARAQTGATPINTVGIWGQDRITGLPCLVAPASSAGSTTCAQVSFDPGAAAQRMQMQLLPPFPFVTNDSYLSQVAGPTTNVFSMTRVGMVSSAGAITFTTPGDNVIVDALGYEGICVDVASASGLGLTLDMGVNTTSLTSTEAMFQVGRATPQTGFISANGRYCGPIQGRYVRVNDFSGTATVTPILVGRHMDFPDRGYSSFTMAGTGTFSIKSGVGKVDHILVGNMPASGTIVCYDNTAASGTQVMPLITFAAATVALDIPLHASFNTGLTCISTAATGLTATAYYR